MNLNQIDTKNFILTLFKRDDGERILLGAGAYAFKDDLQHFQPNVIANDVIEKQGTDGQLLAGQVRRCQTQTFNGYIGDASTTRERTEHYRRQFIQFFRTNHFYTAIYILPNGDAIQRRNGYLVEAPSVPEQYQRFPEYSVGMQFEDLNYYTYNENDQGEETYAQTVDILPEGNLTGGLVWDGDGVVWSNQGKHIAALKGDTYQVTTTGKNLYNSAAALPESALTHSGNANASATSSTITVTNAETTDGFAPLLNANSPKLSEDIYVTLPANTNVRISFKTNRSTGIKALVYGYNAGTNTHTNIKTMTDGNGYTLATGSRTQFALRFGNAIRNSSLTYYDIQFEIGTSTTSFEPYTGGAPSPSPDFPQPIQTVTGSQMIYINGKNFIGATEDSRVDRGVTSTKNQDGTLTFSGTASATYFQITAQSISGGIVTATDCNIPAGEYTLWLTHSTSQFGLTLRLYYSSGQNDYKQVAVAKNATSTTFTIDRPAVAFYIWANGTTVNQSINETLGIQLEAGSTPTSFEAWRQQTYPLDLGTIELAKIGTAQDRIYKDGGDWKVEKNTGHETRNVDVSGISGLGSGQTTVSSDGAFCILNSSTFWVGDYSTTLGKALASENLGTYKFDSTITRNTSANTMQDGTFCQRQGTNDRIYFRNTAYIGKTGDQVKAILLANSGGTNAWWPLTTPTTTTITDTNLIAQLDAIDEALEAGGTITVTPAAGNRAAIITTRPSRNGGAVWEASGGHSTNTITVGGLFAVQPVWKIVGPAETPVLENITDGTSLSYIGNIPEGQTLTIDSSNQTAYLDGANVKNNVRGTWQQFQPGDITVRYSGANVTKASTIEWNEVVG